MAGDGLVRPLNAPAGQPPAYGTQPGASSPVVIANKVVIIGPGGGEFVYSAAPASGTLIATVTGAAGTAQPGSNPYVQGITAYAFASNLAVGLVANTLNFYQLSGGVWTTVAQIFYDTGTGRLSLGLAEASGITVLTLSVTGTITATAGTASSPTLITTDTWHSITPGGTWTASGSGVNGFFYRLQEDGNVLLAWDVNNNNANPGTLGTLPAGYRPATTVRLQSGWAGTGPAAYNNAFNPTIQITSAGVITGNGLFVATLTLFGTAILPLGSL